MKTVNTAIAFLTCAIMLVPLPVKAGIITHNNTKYDTTIDVALSSTGELKGSVINADYKAQSGKEVIIKKGEKEIARTVTNAKGEFAVSDLDQGIYVVSSEKGLAQVRVWDAVTAPPVAEKSVQLQTNAHVVRAQNGTLTFVEIVVVTASFTALGLSIYAIEEVHDGDKPKGPASP